MSELKLTNVSLAYERDRGFGRSERTEVLGRVSLTLSAGEFVSVIAALPRIVTLHDFNIQTGGRGYDQLTMDVTAKTYRYLDDQEIAAASASRRAGSK